MILWDVNLWVYAFRADSPLHSVARETLNEPIVTREPFLFYPFVAASFMRLVTNPTIFVEPSDVYESWRFLDTLETNPAAKHAEVDRQTYAMFKHLCLVTQASGNDVPDALLAASALRHGALLITTDKDLLRYPGIEVRLIS